MKGPAFRDDDAMPVLLRSIKADIARLSARVTVPVGQGWRIEQRDANLVAVLPGDDAEFVIASPGGECGKILACLADSLGVGLEYDSAGRVLGVNISADAGNGLGTGTDGGLYAAAGGGSGDPVVVSGPYQAPGIVNGQDVHGYDWEDFPGSWQVPPGSRDPDTYVYSHPYFDDDLYVSAGMTYDDQHADPRTGVSIHVAEATNPNRAKSVRLLTRTFEWWLAKFNSDPHWCKDWCEIAFTAYFTEPAPKFVDPASGTSYGMKFCIMEFYPGASVWLSSDGYKSQINVRAGPVGHITREYAAKKTEWVAYSDMYFISPEETYGYTGRSDYIPFNTLLRFRGVFRRGGESALYLYYGDPAKPDDEYDVAWTFGPEINFDWTNWTAPGFTVGHEIYEGDSLNRSYEYWKFPNPELVPAIRIPEYWISNITFKIDPVDDPRRGTRPGQGISWGNVAARVQRAGADVAGATVTISPVTPAEGLTQITKSEGGYVEFFSVQLGTWKITATDGISTASIIRDINVPWNEDEADTNGDPYSPEWTIQLP